MAKAATSKRVDLVEGDETVVVKKICAIASAEEIGLVDGQSKILNWTYNNLLSQLSHDYARFAEISSLLDFSGDLSDEADELRRERHELGQTFFGRYGMRNLLPLFSF